MGKRIWFFGVGAAAAGVVAVGLVLVWWTVPATPGTTTRGDTTSALRVHEALRRIREERQRLASQVPARVVVWSATDSAQPANRIEAATFPISATSAAAGEIGPASSATGGIAVRPRGGTVLAHAEEIESSSTGRSPGVSRGGSSGSHDHAESGSEGEAIGGGTGNERDRPDYTPWPEGAPTPVPTWEGTGWVIGHVQGEFTGQGLSGQAVSYSGPEADGMVVSGVDGQFVVENLPSGPYRLQVQGSDTQVNVFVYPDQETTVVLRVPESTEIAGQVLEQRGNGLVPVASAIVQLYRMPQQMLLDETESDTSGHYVVLNAIPEVPLRVVAQLPGYASNFRDVLLHGTDPFYDADIVLAPEGKIWGRLTDANGRPVVGASLSVEALSDTMGAPPPRVTIDASGRYEVAPVLAGLWKILGRAGGYCPDVKMVTISRDSLTPQVNLILGIGEVIRGVVVVEENGRDRPIPDAEVRMEGYNYEDSTTTDTNGQFAFDCVLRQISPDLIARHPRYGASSFTKPVPGQTMRLVLTNAATLQLLVLDADGNPVPSFRIAFHPHSIPNDQFQDSLYTGIEVSQNPFSWQLGLSPYLITVTACGGRQQGFDIEGLVPQQINNRTVRLSPGLPVSGYVRDSNSGRGLASAKVELYAGAHNVRAGQMPRAEGGPANCRLILTDTSGYFAAEDMPPGDLTIVATASGYVRGGTVWPSGVAGANVVLEPAAKP